jgi:epoxyqueuosine reductase QueG
MLYNKLREIAFSSGLSAFGIGNIEDLRTIFDALPLEQTDGLSYGISIGARVSDSVLHGITTGPTRHYLHHYKMLNLLLDQTALKLTLAIQNAGYQALPIPASQIIDWEKQTAHLSHKMIALRAGIGWIGRNNLLVHPEFGSKIRLATVLTDMPLNPPSPLPSPAGGEGYLIPPPLTGGDEGEGVPSDFTNDLNSKLIKVGAKELIRENGCGTCRKCIEACPVSAIKETHKQWDKSACLEKLKYFAKAHNVGQYICGLCVKVCQP